MMYTHFEQPLLREGQGAGEVSEPQFDSIVVYSGKLDKTLTDSIFMQVHWKSIELIKGAVISRSSSRKGRTKT